MPFLSPPPLIQSADAGRRNRMAISRPPEARHNELLAALPAVDFDRIRPQLELVPMKLGEAVYESGARLRHVYFPVTSIVSLLYITQDGDSAEIAVVGNDGVLGISLFMGGETTPNRAIVQSAGQGYRLKAQLLKEEFARFGPFAHVLLRYTQALITQMAQTAVCNRHHSIERQLCRWLLFPRARPSAGLMARDHLPGQHCAYWVRWRTECSRRAV